MVAVVALEAAVPALPFLGLAMVIAHRQARRPPERDRIRGYAMAAAVVAGVAVLLLW
jgi:putative NIF3 family GTP cyclohydrolase 1 type 2